MWSAWPETVSIYLGGDLSMLSRQGGDPLVLEHGTTWPLDRVLQQLLEQGRVRSRSRLRVHLGGLLCPAMEIKIPGGLKGREEFQVWASTQASQVFGGSLDGWTCALDPFSQDVLGAMPTHARAAIEEASRQNQCKIASIQPLWSLATRLPQARPSSIHGIVLVEPGSTTVIIGSTGNVHAVTLTGAASAVAPSVRRWLAGHGASENGLLKIGFSAAPSSPPLKNSTAWPSNWYRP